MASNANSRSDRPNSTTTTTTTTTTTFSSSRRSGTNNYESRTSSRTLQPTVHYDGDGEQVSRSTSNVEPFPQLPADSISRIQSPTPRSTVSAMGSPTPGAASSVPRRMRPISIQRLSSTDLSRQRSRSGVPDRNSSTGVGRRRSASAPQGPDIQVSNYDAAGTPLQRTNTVASNLAMVPEDETQYGGLEPEGATGTRPHRSGSSRLRKASDAAKSVVSRMSGSQDHAGNTRQDEYESEVVDLLDVLDPEVSALTTLTNVQNSLFVPDLGGWLNRRPTYTLSRTPSRIDPIQESKPLPPTPSSAGPLPPPKDFKRVDIPSDVDEEFTPTTSRRERRESMLSMAPSIASFVQQDHFAVLPHGVSLEGWTVEEKEMLDDHVRHMLHSKRSKFKRSMRAFGKYVRRPLGFFVTLYATLITLFGLAWVLFLIGWIYVGERQNYIINIIDHVLVALFAIVGDGMAPFRAVDTYHMIYIAHYHHFSWRLRKEQALPKLQDHNDLPNKQVEGVDIEALKLEEGEFSVLNAEQQKKLDHHTAKFCKSHSFYKPHETATHHAFPLRLLVAIVVLLDCHSLFQIALGVCTWSISYHVRPAALTATILCCSITVNILAGVLIKVGDGKTRKKDVLKRMYRQELTCEAIKKVEKKVDESKDLEVKQEKELEREWDQKHAISHDTKANGSRSGSRSSDSP